MGDQGMPDVGLYITPRLFFLLPILLTLQLMAPNAAAEVFERYFVPLLVMWASL